MSLTEPMSPVLLLIDVQQGFDDPCWGARNNPDAETNIALILNVWRTMGYPVIHVQHRSLEPGSPLREESAGFAFKSEALPKPDEMVITKTVNSAFIGTDLEERLRAMGAKEVVIVGLTTDHCVSTTTRMAGNLGFDVTLIADATATFDRESWDGRILTAEDIHQVSLASLHKEFCQVRNTRDFLEGLSTRSVRG